METDESNLTTWSTISCTFNAAKTGLVTFSLRELALRNTFFHVDGCSDSSRVHGMVLCLEHLKQLGISLIF